MEFCIPEVYRTDVEKALARYRKKAAAYGVPFEASCGGPYAKVVSVNKVDYVTQTIGKVGEMTVEVFDLTIDGERIKKGPYTVLARIEHMDGGNVVTTFSGAECRPEWAKMPPRCEHCGGNHGQKVTYIVRHDVTSHETQVGRTCLKDYCGINPQAVGWSFELREIIEGMDVERYEFPEGGGKCRAYQVEDALALAVMLQRTQGYTASDRPGSNKAMLCDLVRKCTLQVTEADRARAEEIIQATKAMSERDAIDSCLVNVQALIASGYCKLSHMGYIAYAPLAYERYQAKQAEKAKRDAATDEARRISQYVGQIGQRLVIEVAKMDLITSWETQYGWTYLYKFVDKAGNVYVWFASRCIDDTKRIKATVKDHSERDGVRQTVLTRCVAA